MAEPAESIAEVVRAVPGVYDLHGGMFGEVATYLPRRRVVGVRTDGETTEIHVALYVGAPIRETAGRIRDDVTALVGGVVDVTVEDIVPRDEPS
ncbi:hypothetical protein G4H71_14150 [Rhodococcus triatomae]|uniref:Asp23/Gls24 family envelope stress response protein n=1 Tax=Rhodococcus triatomae TaxID=300028 RepID=A0A1G8NR27_9NOCA|nr:hypothetical protein [Rhodococcus triatomae]QNG20066.1 hypothetical protein G4H72_16225 [Rhodococcus triatomae]QNG24018.1 hypothetical protein G4H71_14150 [Rhodococcus triatomae]SDI82673.1 hypothetical protein SAMN05444695_111146 [Rhodococcus triatomae]